MKLELGKRYTRRDGTITGPLEYSNSWLYPFCDPADDELYSDGGLCIIDDESGEDLIAEYTEPDSVPFAPEKTLRDEFAMAALTGMLADSTLCGVPSKDLADISYLLADAMLAQRLPLERRGHE